MQTTTPPEHLDVLILVGAGLSGVGAGYHLQPCPRQELRHLRGPRRDGRHLGPVPLSRRALRLRHVHAGLSFRPWTEAKAIADGPAILNYLRETAGAYGIDKHSAYGRVKRRRGRRRSRAGRWKMSERAGEEPPEICASPAVSCSCAPATTTMRKATRRTFRAREVRRPIVHPQAWPEDLDYAGKRVVVIGSGATAVTLVPELAGTGGARHHAAALAHLCRRAPGRGRSPTGCAQSAAEAAYI